ncbi:hypothetical protein SE15_12890 [Thermanaerothrix daxensis]|uniref:Uncharacterized protein n=1 Tax=Thermanaerothrix daxensis TaxID=869279 RepID=A0A0P6Y9Z8_9CHLR|nr:hypothetical protein SE15_12890 [Thermanaerothrix daxensis]
MPVSAVKPWRISGGTSSSQSSRISEAAGAGERVVGVGRGAQRLKPHAASTNRMGSQVGRRKGRTGVGVQTGSSLTLHYPRMDDDEAAMHGED